MADNFFTQKLGPLPVWAWGGIGAVGLVAVVALRRPKTAATSAQPSTAVQPYGPPSAQSPLAPILINQGSPSTSTAAVDAQKLTGAQQQSVLQALQSYWRSVNFPLLQSGQYSGAGVFIPGEQVTPQGHFIEAPNAAVAGAVPTFYEPVPGQFYPTAGTNIPGTGTPLYVPVY